MKIFKINSNDILVSLVLHFSLVALTLGSFILLKSFLGKVFDVQVPLLLEDGVNIAILLFIILSLSHLAAKCLMLYRESTRRENENEKREVANIYFRNKEKTNLCAVTFSGLSILACIFLFKEIPMEVLLISTTMVFFILLNGFIVNYRIQKGYYGSSDHEAREILDFILRNSDDLGGSGKSEVFPKRENERTKIVEGVLGLVKRFV